nr:retrovirus-related Pol polyprotein from transposon TNT 1-94 [Tanacetum cinerariifolium]
MTKSAFEDELLGSDDTTHNANLNAKFKIDYVVLFGRTGYVIYTTEINTLYLGRKPDILFVVGLISRFMEEPTTKHLKIEKRILRYIKGTIDYDMFYSTSKDFKLVGYRDSDWAGSKDDGSMSVVDAVSMNAFQSVSRKPWYEAPHTQVVSSKVYVRGLLLVLLVKRASYTHSLLVNCMRTRNSYFPNNSSATILRRRNKRRTPNIVEPELRTIIEMADNRTMEELLQAPKEGYEEPIVILKINADHFEIKTNLLQLVQTNPYHGLERENPHTHINTFKRITSTLKFRDVPNDVIKLMMFPYSLKGNA